MSAPNPAAKIRQWVLFAVLIVVAGAAVYEHLVAGPRYKAVQSRLDQADRKTSSTDAAAMTNLDIRAIIGFGPSQTRAVDGHANYQVETYRWPHVLPRRVRELHVLYFDDGNQLIYKGWDPTYNETVRQLGDYTKGEQTDSGPATP